MKFLTQQNHIRWLVAICLALLTACGQGAKPNPDATPTNPPLPFDVTYCDIAPADFCLEGFGLDTDNKLIVMFTAADQAYADIYIRADGPDGEIHFECQKSEDFPENVSCLGDGESFPEGESIKLNVYSKGSDKFLAIGVFNVAIGSLPESAALFHATTTPVLSLPTASRTPSYPNPAYPNPSYPNRSYPNQTRTPTPTSTRTPTPTSTPTQ